MAHTPEGQAEALARYVEQARLSARVKLAGEVGFSWIKQQVRWGGHDGRLGEGELGVH
jgi:hypothetical protein